MVESRSTPIPQRPWRVGESCSPEFGGIAQLCQPSRLDVFVHLLALEQLAGLHPSGLSSGGDTAIDWLDRSEQFSREDDEVGVAELAAELLTCGDPELQVSIGSGGRLVHGATTAAAALYSSRTVGRQNVAGRPIDRSMPALRALGWSESELRRVISAWVRVDPAAAAVVVDLRAPGADEALHELSCRYDIMSEELDHLSPCDATALSASSGGSVRILTLRASDSFSGCVERNRSSVVASSMGPDLAKIARLWAPGRERSTSSSHEQLLRRIRRRERRDHLLALARGR